ncbi:MAG: BACON domain-containing carbohydrate-binding protein [Rikenellaceae bacterium]
MKRLFLVAALAALTFSSCDKMIGNATDELLDDKIEDTLEVTFDPSLTSATRVTSDLFETYDCITVNAEDTNGETFASAVSYTYRNGIFSSDNCPLLDFYHVMTSILVDIKTPGKEGGVMTFYGFGDVWVDVDKFSTTSSSTSQNCYIAAENGSGSYKVILAPQTVAAGTLMASYSVGGTTYEWRMESTKTYAQGCRYYVEWDLDENLISFDSYIHGWDDGSGDVDDDVDDAVDSSYTLWFSHQAQDAELCIYDYINSSTTYIADYKVYADVDWIILYDSFNDATMNNESGYFTMAIDANSSGASRSGCIIIEVFDEATGLASIYVICVEQGYSSDDTAGDTADDTAVDTNGDGIIDGNDDQSDTSSSGWYDVEIGVAFNWEVSSIDIYTIEGFSLYSASTISTTSTWITASISMTSDGMTYLTIAVAANTSTSDRSGYVYIENYNGDGTASRASIMVAQEAYDATAASMTN